MTGTTTTIGELISRHGGSIKTGPFGTVLSAKEFATDGAPIVSVGEIGFGAIRLLDSTPRAPDAVIRRLPEYVLQTHDIVFARKGAVDRCALVRPDQNGWFLGSDAIRLRVPPTSDARFVAYQLSSPRVRAWLRQHATGTTMPSLNQTIVERIPIALPAIEEQRRVSDVLAHVDDKIELNLQMNESLELLARGVFQQRVVTPAREALPEGWTRGTLGEHLDVTRGLSYSGKALTKEGGLPLHNLDSVKEGGGYKRSGIKRYTGQYRERHVIRPGDIVVANTEQGHDELLIGCPAIVPRAFGEIGLFSQDLSRVVPKSGSPLTPRLIYLLLANERVRRAVAAYANGTTVNHLPREGLERPTFPLPPAPVLAEVDTLVAPLLERIEANEDENATLTELRDTLLPGLVSGSIRLG